MKNKEIDLLVKYLKTHDKYKVTTKQLETISKFEKWNDVSLQDIDRMKNIIEEYDLNKKDSIDLHAIKQNVNERKKKEENIIKQTENEMQKEGIDYKRLGWHRKLHSYREYEKGQIEKDLNDGIQR